MLQFYFLSVLLNILVGLVLFFGDASSSEDSDLLEETETDARKQTFFLRFFGKGSFTDEAMFYLVVGGLSVFVGFIKLLSAVNGPAFFGDLFPSVAGFLGGIAVLILYFEKKSSVSLELNHVFNLILIESRKYLGLGCIAVALMHFVLPGVLFL